MTEILIKSALLLANATVLGAVLVIRSRKQTTTAKSQDNDKRWAPAKPTLGGLLFALTLVGGQLLFGFVDLWANLAMLSAFAIGLIDDLRRINPMQKLMGQWLAAACVFGLAFSMGLPWEYVLIYTFGTLVMMNSINMLDNMDGVATLGSLPFWLLSALLFLIGKTTDPIGMLVLIAALAFLLFNAHPSKMFMGDSGSMLLGVAAVLCMIELNEAYAGGWFVLLPMWMFLSTLTLADTALVVIRRLQHGKSPMQGGKDHSTHHLVYRGWSQTKVNYVFLAMGIFQSLTAFFLVVSRCIEVIALVAMIVYPVVWFIILWNISKNNLKSGKFDYSSH